MSMMDVPVAVERVGLDVALRCWQEASNATVFTHPHVLESLTRQVHWWLATETGRPAALWPICLDDVGRVAPPALSYYVGPLELSARDESPRARLLRGVAVHGPCLDRLRSEYGELQWSTVPGHLDLRPWLWHVSEGRQPAVEPRFTATVHGLDRMSWDDLLLRMSPRRRKEYRQAERGGAVVLPGTTDRQVAELYVATMTASGAGDTAKRRADLITALLKVASAGHGFVVACGLGAGQAVRAVSLVLEARGRACEVLVAAEPEWRSLGFNAFLRLHSMSRARERGASCYDFNGANSLMRGLDKHSYGAEAELYFTLRL